MAAKGRHRDREQARLLWLIGAAAAVVILITVLSQWGGLHV